MNCIPGRVMVFGTFDIFHPGHQDFIEQALREGEELIVVIARDKAVRQFKGVLTNSESQRKNRVEEAFPEVVVILGDLEDPLAPVRANMPEKVCVGYDQTGYIRELREAFPQIKITHLNPYFPEKYKSSKLRFQEGLD